MIMILNGCWMAPRKNTENKLYINKVIVQANILINLKQYYISKISRFSNQLSYGALILFNMCVLIHQLNCPNISPLYTDTNEQ